MHSYDYPRPALTADMVALCFHKGALKVLLIQRAAEPFKGSWALPGGFVDQGESPQRAAARELQEETGLTFPLSELIEVGAFGEPGRDPRAWVVSVAMLGLVPLHEAEPPQLTAGDDAREARWWPLSDLAQLTLAFDHEQIIKRALERLRALTTYDPAPLSLLPQPFRHRHARQLYCQLWGETIAPRAFKSWLRRVEAIERVGRALYLPKGSIRRPWER